VTIGDQPTVAEALASVRASREGVAGRLQYPLWYDAIYAGSAGGIVAVQALPPPWPALGALACTAALLFMFRAFTRRTGLSVMGLTPKRARWVAIALGVLLVLLVVAAMRVGENVWWAPLMLGAVAAAAAHLAAKLWRRVYRVDLREGA
jgi:hypothetical protein